MRAAAILLLLGACELPPLTLEYVVSNGPLQSCGTASCSGVTLGCDSVLHVRFVNPSMPNESYATLCRPVEANTDRDLCAIARIDLKNDDDSDIVLKAETLEVQVMVWPRAAVAVNAETGALDCTTIYGVPTVIAFNAQNFPKETTPSPALGGRAYYHRGDDRTVVTLGCSNLASVNSCAGNLLEVTATVTEFDKPGSSVIVAVANNLFVHVGEPQLNDNDRYSLTAQQLRTLGRGEPGPIPSWLGSFAGLAFERTACIDVTESTGEATAAVHCQSITDEQELALIGVRLPKQRLEKIVRALDLDEFPARGLTIGVVVDELDRPVSGLTVETGAAGRLRYLRRVGDDFEVAVGATETTDTGIFVDDLALYGTDFSVSPPGGPAASAIGGVIDGKATIVVLRVAPAMF